MNSLHIIGNLVRDPETRVTQSGSTVCSFTVAVNRKKKVQGQPDADFFRVSAWNQLGEVCQKYLAKGRKVSVVGSVTAHAYTTQDGKPAASLDVMAGDIEFLSSKGDAENHSAPDESGYTRVNDDDVPWGN
jgi:single-strand DNA-binding protein